METAARGTRRGGVERFVSGYGVLVPFGGGSLRPRGRAGSASCGSSASGLASRLPAVQLRGTITERSRPIAVCRHLRCLFPTDGVYLVPIDECDSKAGW